MPSTTVRDRVLRAVEELPRDASFDDVMERVYLLQKVEQGRRQIEDGQGIPHEEAKRRMKRWHA